MYSLIYFLPNAYTITIMSHTHYKNANKKNKFQQNILIFGNIYLPFILMIFNFHTQFFV